MNEMKGSMTDSQKQEKKARKTTIAMEIIIAVLMILDKRQLTITHPLMIREWNKGDLAHSSIFYGNISKKKNCDSFLILSLS